MASLYCVTAGCTETERSSWRAFIASLLGVLRLNGGDAEPLLRHFWVY